MPYPLMSVHGARRGDRSVHEQSALLRALHEASRDSDAPPPLVDAPAAPPHALQPGVPPPVSPNGISRMQSCLRSTCITARTYRQCTRPHPCAPRGRRAQGTGSHLDGTTPFSSGAPTARARQHRQSAPISGSSARCRGPRSSFRAGYVCRGLLTYLWSAWAMAMVHADAYACMPRPHARVPFAHTMLTSACINWVRTLSRRVPPARPQPASVFARNGRRLHHSQTPSALAQGPGQLSSKTKDQLKSVGWNSKDVRLPVSTDSYSYGVCQRRLSPDWLLPTSQTSEPV